MKRSIDILGVLKRVPAGLMLIPMLITALINTFFPAVLQIGNPTTAMFTAYGTPVLVGVSIFVTGTQIRVEQLSPCIKRCGSTFLLKITEALLVCWLVSRFIGVGTLWGASALAIMVIFCSSNPGIYLALVHSYGDEIDEAGYGLYNLIGNPILAIVAISSVSGGVNYLSIVAILAPLVVGFILGNLDEGIRRFMAPGNAILLPFMGFTFGASINLRTAVKSGMVGVMLSLFYVAFNFALMLFWDRIVLKRPGYAGVSLGAVAGVAVAIPAMIAELLPEYLSIVPTATAQIATVLIISSITIPLLTKLVVKRFGDGKIEEA
jgi:2-keto-3-deoxygluconate permease